jgi:hypothetical protein
MSGGASAGPPDTSGMRPRRPWAGLASLLLLAIAAAFTPPLLADDAAAERLREPGAVLLIRHALAPGIGDPENFQLGDCATQRNLSDEGRQQARAIGRWLRSRGIQHARVYSSQWCRCSSRTPPSATAGWRNCNGSSPPSRATAACWCSSPTR